MRKNEFLSIKNLTRIAVSAAVYAMLTLVVSPLAFGAVQFRFSEILVLLCFYRKDYAVGMTMGCFIANLLSPFGLDIIFGTLGTAAAAFLMYYCRNIYLSAVLPVITNGVMVGLEFHIYGEPLWFSMGTVALGELAVMIVGVVIFKTVVERPHILSLIASTKEISKTVAGKKKDGLQ